MHESDVLFRAQCSAAAPPLLPHCMIQCIEFNTERFPSKQRGDQIKEGIAKDPTHETNEFETRLASPPPAD